MRGIVVPHNTIPFSNQERSTATSSTAQSRPAQAFQDLLSEASRLQKEKMPPAAQGPSAADKNYTIQSGDTLSEIVAAESKRLGLNHSSRELYNMVNQAASLNDLTNADTIFPGQKIDLTSICQPLAESACAPTAGPVFSSATQPSTIPKNSPELLPESKFQSPVNGRISSAFGRRNHPVLGEMLHHNGIDISQPTGTPVKPLSSGVVTFSGDNGGYGQMVEIDHGNGLTSRYAHLSKLSVRKGEQIDPEQTIGEVGQTGLTTGPHLHLEIRRQNTPVDPLTVLNRNQVEDNLLFAEARTTHRL